MNTIENMLITLLRAGICGGEIDNATKENINEENLEKLYKLAQSHDVAHIVADVLFKQSLMPDGEIAVRYKRSLMMSILRYQQLSFELNRIRALFEENQIPYMPLKGSVLRKYYPEPWLRTSCDIDILVNRKDLQRAADLLVHKFNYATARKGSHDWSFFSGDNAHIELHYDLIEQEALSKNQPRHKWNTAYLGDIWSYSAPADHKSSEYKMTAEMFYYYHIAHMAKHFESGGCGVRTFIDLWILNNKFEYNRNEAEKLLSESGLLQFEHGVRTLSEVWFSNAEADELTKATESYVLKGGVYGNTENRVAFQQNKRGSKLKFAISRIFLPYEFLRFQYPVLQKQKWLLPICQVRRWFRLVFFGRVKRSVTEFRINQGLTDEKIKDTAELLKRLGL